MSRTTSSEDYRLARRAARGERRAWDEIIDLYGGRIFHLALQFARNPSQAEDLTQEIFLRLFQKLSKYRGDTPLVAWTLRLSRNLCIDHYRRARIERESVFLAESALENLISGSDPARDAERRELLHQIDEVLPCMKPDLADVVILRDLQGLSYDEISALLRIPIGTLKSRLNRGRRDLMDRLGQRHEERAKMSEGGRNSKTSLRMAPC